MNWKGTRVAVTGAGGFIGSHLTEALAAKGAKVRALVRYNHRNHHGHLEDLPKALRPRVEVRAGDVQDPHYMMDFVKDQEVVFHLAALIPIPYSYVAPSSYVSTNVQGTLNVLQACRFRGVKKTVHTSTSETYGTALYAPIDEKHPMQGQSPYSASKIGADAIVESFHRSFGMPVATARPFNTYGPRQSARAVIPAAIAQLAAGLPAVRLGSLEPVRDFSYVADTVEGFLAVAASRKTDGEVVNISVGVYYDELYKLCAAEASLSGTRLVGVQHGGQYGTAAWSNPEWHERSVADAYLTWGWSEDAVTIPVPVPWLSYPPQRAPRAGEVLLVSTSGLREAHELFPAPMGPQWAEFLAWRGRFLDALGPADLAATRLRPFPKDYGWGEREEAARRWPSMRVESGGSFAESLSRAALVVTDHPGTTFLETLAWEIPGVHFWEEGLWESRPAAAAAIEPLRRAEIVHATPESAARKAGEIRKDAAAWWASTREARRAFTRLYARADPAWASSWAKALRAVAGDS